MTAAPSTADQTIVRAPTARAWTNWTTDDLEIAEALTASGRLDFAATLCWALLGDGRVKAALETLVKGLLALPLAWEESGDGRSAGRVIRALEKDGDFYAAHSEAALCALATWGVLLGVGLAQRVWVLRKGRWLGVLRPYDARNLRWDRERRAWFVRTATGEVQILPGDRRWVLYAPSCSGAPDGDELPWMYGAWRACARPWLGKYLAWSDWQHHAEIHGSPIRTADVDVELGKKVRDELTAALGDLGADAAALPPKGVKLKLLEALADTWKMFPAEMDTAAREIVIAITGQSSSTEVVQGQDTGATLHGRVRQDLIDASARTLSTCVHDGSLEDYAELNFGARELAPWPCWQTDPPGDLQKRGAAYKALGEGIAALDAVAPKGQRVDRKAVFEDAGVPLEDIPADEIADADAAAEPDPTDPAEGAEPAESQAA